MKKSSAHVVRTVLVLLFNCDIRRVRDFDVMRMTVSPRLTCTVIHERRDFCTQRFYLTEVLLVLGGTDVSIKGRTAEGRVRVLL